MLRLHLISSRPPCRPASLLLGLCITLFVAGPALAAGELSLQPEPRGSISPDRQVDIEHLELDLSLELEQGRVAGSATHRVRPLIEGLRQLSFDQVGLRIEQVRLGDQLLTFRLSDEHVHVQLPEGLVSDQSFELRFDYSAEPDNGLHFRLPARNSPDSYPEVWSQGENEDSRYWFPTYDAPRDRFTYEGRYTVAKGLRVVSNGTLVAQEPADRTGYTRWHYRLDGGDLVSYLVMVAVAPYQEWTGTWRDRPLHFYAAGDADEAAVRGLLDRTGAILEFFSDLIGTDYPYEVYRQVLVQRFIYTGMENTAATVLDRGLLGSAEDDAINPWPEAVVAHEAAHQWFGDLLTCRTFRHLWLNEGFATFFTDLWMEHSRGPAFAARKLRQRYATVASQQQRRPSPLVKRFFNGGAEGAAANPYRKGAAVLQMLRVLLGDEVFFRAIRRYVAQWHNGLVQSSDLQRILEQESGLYLDWFFDQWVYMGGSPKLKISHSFDANESRLRIVIRQVQEAKAGIGLFQFPLELEIDGQVERIWIDSKESAIQLEREAAPGYIAVDPRGGLLAEIETQQSAAQWLAQLSSPHPYAVERALQGLRALKGSAREPARQSVHQLLADPLVPIERRLGAAEILSHWRSSEDVDALLSSLARERAGEGSAALRWELVRGLGRVLPREDVLVALEERLARDPLDRIRAAALSSLARLEEERVRPRAIAALRSAVSEDWVVQRRGADALGRWGRVDDLSALAAARRSGSPSVLQNAALWASLQIAEREPVGQRRELARSAFLGDAEAMLHDRNLRTRQTAVSVLSRAGDRGSISALEALAVREDNESLRERVHAAVKAIRTRKDEEPKETDGELKARLKGLEDRIKEMERSVKELGERR